jgi:hypothetical protein
MQALIASRSSSNYYTPGTMEDNITDVSFNERDEVGLVRTICVKVL